LRAEPANSTLLLIEDHRDIAEMIAEYFERRGFAIDHAADGVTGLHLAVSNHYDVIVADVMLPGIDGIALCRTLREDARRDTPLLMLTALAHQSLRAQRQQTHGSVPPKSAGVR
jgi:DNA-binding response OmpR family regulator